MINIPAAALAKQVVGCGNMSGCNVDKFQRFGLTAEPAKCVRAPLIGECYASLECKLVDTRLAAQYNFFILEVLKAHIDPAVTQPKTIHHQGRGQFMIAGRTIRLPSRMK